MATTVNARDVLISGGTRTQAVTLPSDISLAGNLVGTVDGLPLSSVKNSSITLSSSGALNGAGGGSITALPYSNVTGGPPASATANFFTTSASDPTGGANGDAHYNSSTNVMWFKISGTWQKGGTINASQITTGTLAAARIAASSITSDKLSVSSLSAIAANLGTVTAGNITGTASISISGSGTFNGATATVVGNAAIAANVSDSAVHGVYARSTGVRTGVFGFNSGTGTGIQGTNTGGGIGVFGSASGVSGSKGGEFVGSGNGVTALKAGKVSGSGNALEVVGPMTISSTTLVSNLNAQLWNSATLQMNAAAGSSTATFNNTTKPGTNSGGNGWMIITYGGTKYAIPTWVVTP